MIRSVILLATCVSVPLLRGDSGVEDAPGSERLPVPPMYQEGLEFPGLNWPGNSFDAIFQGTLVEIREYNRGEAEIEIGENPTVIIGIRVSFYETENFSFKHAGPLVKFAIEGEPEFFEYIKNTERNFQLIQVKGELRALVPWGC